MIDILSLIQERRSVRAPFDPERPIAATEVSLILEAARWTPTAHNMQNFDILVIDDQNVLAKLGNITNPPSETFIRENFEHLSFTEEELRNKKVGILGNQFPPAWRTPGADFAKVALESSPSFLKDTIKNSPLVLIVTYDASQRAPASEGDVLGFISLGCLMENMWLMAQSLGIDLQIMSTFSGEQVEKEIKKILEIPDPLKIAFACRLGYTAAAEYKPLRVRRDLENFTHHNHF